MTPIEKDIATALVKKAIELGYTVSVNDGEEWFIKRSREWETIINAMGATDSDFVKFRDPDHGQSLGAVLLIYGNGCDLISDHSDNPTINALVAAAQNQAGVA